MSEVIFISGRFRSGTTFLWHLFNQLPQFCAWYEPLHPQLLSHIRHTAPKADHRGVSDYWQSYRQHPDFERNYQAHFGFEQLWLEADDEYPKLYQYLSDLIELSGEKTAVIQFNRMDFRLAWLKQHFPTARLVHIERNPLQLWHSQRKHIAPEHRNNGSYPDAYELAQWSLALTEELPFLTNKTNHRHAFFRFYAIYRISQVMAQQHADLSLALETDIFESDLFVNKLGEVTSLSTADRQHMRQLKANSAHHHFENPEVEQLTAIMTEVELLLHDSGLLDCGVEKLSSIKRQNSAFWQCQSISPLAIREALLAMAWQQAELTAQLAINSNPE